MFFVARSFVCIGLVASALPAPSGPDAHGAGTLLQATAGSTAAALERYCADNPARCLRAARATAEAARFPDDASPRKLRTVPAPASLKR